MRGFGAEECPNSLYNGVRKRILGWIEYSETTGRRELRFPTILLFPIAIIITVAIRRSLLQNVNICEGQHKCYTISI
jgi:hypothetical protein